MLNKKGMTLIEVMIALVILLLVSLALMQTVTLGINSNVRNLLRDEAVKVADTRMIELMNTQFDDGLLAAPGCCPAETVVTREFRNFSINFTPTRTITDLGGDDKRIDITVAWDWRGNNYTHTISTVVRRP